MMWHTHYGVPHLTNVPSTLYLSLVLTQMSKPHEIPTSLCVSLIRLSIYSPQATLNPEGAHALSHVFEGHLLPSCL